MLRPIHGRKSFSERSRAKQKDTVTKSFGELEMDREREIERETEREKQTDRHTDRKRQR